MQLHEPIQKFKVIQDSFLPGEARSVVNSMLDSYIQYYNLQYMRNWEADHNFDSESIEKKIELLKAMKRDFEHSIHLANAEGALLKLEGLLDLKKAG